jgi:hypothetical protein
MIWLTAQPPIRKRLRRAFLALHKARFRLRRIRARGEAQTRPHDIKADHIPNRGTP